MRPSAAFFPVHELEYKENASKSLLVTREPGVGPVAELGTGSTPGAALGLAANLPSNELSQQVGAQELLGVLLFSFRNHVRCQAHPEPGEDF